MDETHFHMKTNLRYFPWTSKLLSLAHVPFGVWTSAVSSLALLRHAYCRVTCNLSTYVHPSYWKSPLHHIYVLIPSYPQGQVSRMSPLHFPPQAGYGSSLCYHSAMHVYPPYHWSNTSQLGGCSLLLLLTVPLTESLLIIKFPEPSTVLDIMQMNDELDLFLCHLTKNGSYI